LPPSPAGNLDRPVPRARAHRGGGRRRVARRALVGRRHPAVARPARRSPPDDAAAELDAERNHAHELCVRAGAVLTRRDACGGASASGSAALRTAAIKEPATVSERAVDQLIGVREVDRLDRERARCRHHDQLRSIAVQLDVCDQPAVRQQGECVQGHAQCACRSLLQRAGVPGRQHVDFPRAKLDRV
jgi:hypothetical protein